MAAVPWRKTAQQWVMDHPSLAAAYIGTYERHLQQVEAALFNVMYIIEETRYGGGLNEVQNPDWTKADTIMSEAATLLMRSRQAKGEPNYDVPDNPDTHSPVDAGGLRKH